ncbi:MAG: 4-hydroxybutyrate dehydrogenase [Ethanoligenens sp.]
MRLLSVHPQISSCKDCAAFCEEFAIGGQDLILTSRHTFEHYLQGKTGEAHVVFLRDFGQGEPSDEMVDKLAAHVQRLNYRRIVGIGGGSILDVSKLFALRQVAPACDLFEKKFEPVKANGLILVPTTCGTGSEVTNISILELKQRNTKLGLAVDAIYADHAVLVPELLQDLPFRFFATSSIDAFIHAIESYLSPRANRMTRLFSCEAMRLIVEGYRFICAHGEDSRQELLEDFLYASLYAGIAFGNAGTGTVHAMSYPFGAAFHVPHGEANYIFLSAVMHVYQQKNAHGAIRELNLFLKGLLDCEADAVYDALEALFTQILPKKPLHAYGTTLEQLEIFTDNVMEKQGRLMANAYVPMDRSSIYSIYETVF